MDQAPSGAVLKKVPLAALHRAAGAVSTGFGGWDLPVRFTSILEEHQAVRDKAGLFDISHMGQLTLEGAGALDVIQNWVSGDISDLAPGRCRYTLALTPEGTVRDDLIIYRLSEQSFFIVLNAAQEEFHLGDLAERSRGKADLRNLHPERVKFDLQGPAAPGILAGILGPTSGVEGIKYFSFKEVSWLGAKVLVSRTGYTGELGYELYIPRDKGEAAWTRLLEGSGGLRVPACGLGARDTLRLEVAYPLAGHELTPEITPEEAGQGSRVSPDKASFPGKEAFVSRIGKPSRRFQVGLTVKDGIPRDGCKIFRAGAEAGRISSGTFSPSLKTGIALAFVSGPAPKPGEKLECEIRGRKVEALVQELPFYEKGTARSKIQLAELHSKKEGSGV